MEGPVTAKVEAVRQNYGTPDAAIVTAISAAILTAMRSAVGTPPDAATVTEHGRRRSYRWQILGVTTATEHSELTAAAGRGPAFAPEVVSIGSVMMFRPARHEPAICAMEGVRHGIQDRLHLSISRQEIRDHCSRSATEHTGTRAYPYKQHAPRSWSGTVEAISRSVAAYQRAAHATEQSACADIMNKLKRHAQALLQKCTPRAYLRECALDVVTDYIWNRTCNVAFLMLLNDILTQQWRPEKLSESETNDAVDLIEACTECLRSFSDEILTDLKDLREPTNTSLVAACRRCINAIQVAQELNWDAQALSFSIPENYYKAFLSSEWLR